MNRYKMLAVEQMDKKLGKFRELIGEKRPEKGWLNAVRKTLSITGKQLGNRLGVSASRVYDIEKGESDDSVTLKSMKQTAEALGCVFVYAVVPVSSLKNIIENRVAELTEIQVMSASHTMSLEAQDIDAEEIKAITERNIREQMDNLSSRLWDDK